MFEFDLSELEQAFNNCDTVNIWSCVSFSWLFLSHTHGIICCKHPVVSHKPQVISLFGRGTSNSAHFTSSSSRSHSSTQHTEPVIACSLNHNFVASSANSLTYCYRHFRAKSLLCYCCSLKWTFFSFILHMNSLCF